MPGVSTHWVTATEGTEGVVNNKLSTQQHYKLSTYPCSCVYPYLLAGSHTQKLASHFSPFTTGSAACSAKSSPLPSSSRL
jgi:hypothetical protein